MNPKMRFGTRAEDPLRAAAAVSVTGLRKKMGGREVLRDVNFEAAPGEIFGLLGPNGAGKTTTLRLISTLLRPDSGEISVAGFNARTHPREIRRQVGIVTADLGVYPRLTVRENLAYMARLCGIDGAWLRARLDKVIDRLQMRGFADKRCEALSSGQRQRVAIARAVVHDPEILIFDEPTSDLDVVASLTIRDYMAEARDEGKCVLFSTHVLHDAERLCDRVAILDQGRVVAGGPPAAVAAAAQSEDLEGAFLRLIGIPTWDGAEAARSDAVGVEKPESNSEPAKVSIPARLGDVGLVR